MNTIAPVQPILPSTSATAQPTVSPEARFQDLRMEQIVRATVAEGGREQVLLDLGHHRLRAETQVPLRTGQSLDLKVTSLSPRLELRLIDDLLGERLNRSLHLLSGKWDLLPPLRELLEGGTPLFDRLSPAARVGLEIWMAIQGFSYEKPDPVLFRHLARRFGLDLEARLARGEKQEAIETLKGALLEVAQKIDDSSGETAERVGRLLQSLEMFQLCQVRLGEAGLSLLPLPLPWLEQGYILADDSAERGGEGENPFRLSLHLSLQGLGDLRVDFLYDQQGVYLRVAGESREKADFIASFQEELREALGPSLQGLVFTEGAEGPAPALIRRVAEKSGMLDTRV